MKLIETKCVKTNLSTDHYKIKVGDTWILPDFHPWLSNKSFEIIKEIGEGDKTLIGPKK